MLLIVGFVLLIVVLFSVMNIIVGRVTEPMRHVDEKISKLEARIDELENSDE